MSMMFAVWLESGLVVKPLDAAVTVVAARITVAIVASL